MWRGACLVLALAAVLAPAAQVPPAADAQPAPARTVVIGDIHGAADAFEALLVRTGLADASGAWTGGAATLVQTGDILDRGAGARRALDRVMALEQAAKAGGGRTELLLGNHEVMNLLRDFHDVTPQIFASFADTGSEARLRKAYDDQVSTAKRTGVAELRPASREAWMAAHPPGYLEYVDALARRGRYGRWLRERKAAVVVDGTLFMHAGLPSASTDSVDDVNKAVARAIDDWDLATDLMVRARLIRPFFTLDETITAAVAEIERIAAALKAGEPLGPEVTQDYVRRLTGVATIGKSPLLAEDGPMWYRGLTSGSTEETAERVGALLQRLGVRRAVFGHTPMLPGRITPRFGGLVYGIDTGMLTSFFPGGRPSALEIQGERLTAIYLDGSETLAPVSPAP
jgi:hypothetical protein